MYALGVGAQVSLGVDSQSGNYIYAQCALGMYSVESQHAWTI